MACARPARYGRTSTLGALRAIERHRMPSALGVCRCNVRGRVRRRRVAADRSPNINYRATAVGKFKSAALHFCANRVERKSSDRLSEAEPQTGRARFQRKSLIALFSRGAGQETLTSTRSG